MQLSVDSSEHNKPLDMTYPRQTVIFRAAFGTWKMDNLFLQNAAIAKALWDAGKLRGGAILYQVWLTDATPQQTYNYLWNLIGPTAPDWLTGIMGDVESWPGTSYAVSGDHSPRFNTLYGLNAHRMGSWLGCKGYGNWSDLSSLWSKRDPRCEFIEARYSSEMPVRPGKIGQQYTDGSGRYSMPAGLPSSTPPFGSIDHDVFPAINDPAAFRAAWGRPSWAALHAAPVVKPPVTPSKPTPTPAPVPKPTPKPTPKPAAPHYPAGHPSVLISPDRSRAMFLWNDGRVEVRHNGKHQAWITPA